MKNFVVILFYLFTSLSCISQFSNAKIMLFSKNVKDSFEIYISTPNNLDNKTCNVVYYLDANIKSGIKIRQLIKNVNYSKSLANTVFIGIGHIGNFHKLRRRDFIPQTSTIGFENAEIFYFFLKEELIPLMKTKFTIANSSLLGHSFGGLFTVYCLFKNDGLFNNYFALSPSLWVNNNAIYKADSKINGVKKAATLLITTGGLENLNKIKSSCTKMMTYLRKMDYQQIKSFYKIFSNKYHNTSVEPALNYIFTNYLNQ